MTTGVEDLPGNAMQAEYQWSFTTGAVPDTTPPTVASTSPVDGAGDVSVKGHGIELCQHIYFPYMLLIYNTNY